MECVEDIERMEPCGAGNPRALIGLLGAKLTELAPIGGGRHLRLRLEKFGRSYEAVWFGHTAGELPLRCGDWADAAFSPQINVFRGHQSVQLLLTDLRPHDTVPAAEILRGDFSHAACDLPERPDFELVWRALVALGGRQSGPLPALVETLAPRLREEKLCVILKVFEELGLLALEPGEGGRLGVKIVPDAGKAALDSSEILRRLREDV